MPRFKSREEYEKWKTERMGTSEEKPVELPQKPSVSLEESLEIQEPFVAPQKNARDFGDKPLLFGEKSPETSKKLPEPEEMFLEPEVEFQRPEEKPWDLQESFPDSHEGLLGPRTRG